MESISPQRPSPIAGSWYEGDPGALARIVDAYIASASLPDLPGNLLGVIAPHAGHVYSGPVAGHAFAALQAEALRRTASNKAIDLVAVVSPMHQPSKQPILTTAHSAFTTPLGDIPVHAEALSALHTALIRRLGYGLTRITNDREHSLEIELPFLQRVLDTPFRLLPIMLRSPLAKDAQALGEALAETLAGMNAFLVASTDLSHFFPQEVAQKMDATMLACFESFNSRSIFELEQSGQAQACGHAAVAAVLWAARALGADTVKVLNYATSGDVSGDYSSVVGYGAAAILQTK